MESTPQTPPEEFRTLNRSLTEKVLERASSDPAWRQQLLDDPEVAMQGAGFPEVPQLEELREESAQAPEEEVAGQTYGGPPQPTGYYQWVCFNMTWRYEKIWRHY